MKEILSRFLFWIVILGVLLLIGGSYFMFVLPLKQEIDENALKLQNQINELQGFVDKTNLANEEWDKVAKKHVEVIREQKDRCMGLLDKYRVSWDEPLEGERNLPRVDKDIFKFVYKEERKKTYEYAKDRMEITKQSFEWLQAPREDKEIPRIRRFYWVQKALFDVIHAGKVVRLDSLRILLPPEDEPVGLFQVVKFEVRVRISFRDLPALMDSILRSPQFIAVIHGVEFQKDTSLKPVIQEGKPVDEPPLTVVVRGDLDLFHKPKAETPAPG